MYKIMSYLFYVVAIIAGYTAAYDLLLQMFPDFGFLELAIGFVATAMFFPLVPLYPWFNSGEWLLALICYACIFIGVALSNQSRKS